MNNTNSQKYNYRDILIQLSNVYSCKEISYSYMNAKYKPVY